MYEYYNRYDFIANVGVTHMVAQDVETDEEEVATVCGDVLPWALGLSSESLYPLCNDCMGA